MEPPSIDPKAARPLTARASRVATQRAEDNASGLFALVTAARRLGTVHARVGARTILTRLRAVDRARIEARFPRAGLRENDIRALGDAAGIGLWRPRGHVIEQFREPGWTWMALVLVRITSPGSGRASCVAKHFVLVVDYLPDTGALVVADTHPSNPPLYVVAEKHFEAAWRAAKPSGPPWAVALYRQ